MKDMADYGLKKNGEGYADPTAYAAITGIQKPGEIWAYKGGDALIIKNHGTFSSILRLVDDKSAGAVDVGGRFTDPRLLSYAYNDKFSIYQGKITPAEFGWVLAEIENALGIEIEPHTATITVDTQESRKLKDELDALRCRLKEADSIANEYADRFKAAEAESVKSKIQLEMMQQMYSDLMEKFLQRV